MFRMVTGAVVAVLLVAQGCRNTEPPARTPEVPPPPTSSSTPPKAPTSGSK